MVQIFAIVQARMGSSRLPGKVLLTLHQKTILGHVITRLQRCQQLSGICIATTLNPIDDVIVAEAQQYGVLAFRGEEEDVLGRYYVTAKQLKADIIVRITSDCPLIDPNLLTKMLKKYLDNYQSEGIDYLSNTIDRTYPRGMDIEILNFESLERTFFEAKEPFQREHVTPYIYFNPAQFKISQYCHHIKNSAQFRLTLDTKEDYQLFLTLAETLGSKINTIGFEEIVNFLENSPEITSINSHVGQKSLI